MSKKSDAQRARKFKEACEDFQRQFAFAQEPDTNPGVALFRIPRQEHADYFSKLSPQPVSLSDVYSILGTNENEVRALEQSIRKRAVREALERLIDSPPDMNDYYTSEITNHLDALGFKGRYAEGFEHADINMFEINGRIENAYAPYRQALRASFKKAFLEERTVLTAEGPAAGPVL